MKTRLVGSVKTRLVGSVLSAALWAGAAGAGTVSYDGNWPVIVTHTQFYDGNYCLELRGSLGGGATLTGPLGTLSGNFQVLGRNLIAIVPEQNGGGFNWGVEFVLPAANGNLGKGAFLVDQDGELESPGVAKVGTKNGC